jgi:hypothetical protein
MNAKTIFRGITLLSAIAVIVFIETQRDPRIFLYELSLFFGYTCLLVHLIILLISLYKPIEAIAYVLTLVIVVAWLSLIIMWIYES